MHSVRSVIVVAAAISLPMASWAEEPVAPFRAPVFQIVPVAPVVGGGAPSDLFLLALDADGAPMTGLKLKAEKTAGLERRWIEVGEGIYRMPFAPPAVLSPSMLTVTARGRSPTRAPLETSASIKLIPPTPAFALEATPSQLILEKGAGASIKVTGIAATELRSAVNAGTVQVTAGTDSEVTLGFQPPNLNFPHNAIVTASDASAPFERYGYDLLRLDGAVDFPVKGEAGAQVALEVAGRTFTGTEPIGADGKGKVRIVVPPGVSQATQITTVNGAESRQDIDLKIPETRRLQLIALPAYVPADGTLPLRVVVVEPGGNPDAAATPTFTVSTGEVGPVTHLGQGVYEATWTPGAAPSLQEATIQVGLGSEAQSETVTLQLVPRSPASVSLVASVKSLLPPPPPPAPKPAPSKDTKGSGTKGSSAKDKPAAASTPEVPPTPPVPSPFEVTATVTGTDGKPFPGALLTVIPTGGTLAGEITDVGDGTYRFSIDPLDTGNAGVSLQVTATSRQVSKNPVAKIVVSPARTRLVNDGKEELPLQLAAVDAFGLPVASVPLSIELMGDGSLASTQLVTDVRGVASTTFVSGTSPGVTGLLVSAGQKHTFTTLLQLPGTAPQPATPWQSPAAEAFSWTPASASLVIPREEGAGGNAPVASIRLGSSLATAQPGARLTLTAAPLDAQGELTRSVVPEFVVTGASLSAPTVNADGSVMVVVAIPEDAAAPVEIRATAGEVVQTLSVPIERSDPWAGDAIAAVPPAPAPAPVTAPRPTPPSDFSWFRLRASGVGSQYRYQQSPSGTPGPLLPTPLEVGGGGGSPSARPLGAEFDLRAWGDVVGVKYLGFHGQARFSSYGVQASAFNGTATDTIPSVDLGLVARYPLDLAGDRYWIGAKGSFLYSDLLTYEGCLEPGCQIRTTAVPVPGLGLGGELGAELGRLFVVGGYTLGLAQATQPYSNALDLNVGYSFLDHVFADLGVGMLTRKVVLEGIESGLNRGALTDSQLMMELGVGFSL